MSSAIWMSLAIACFWPSKSEETVRFYSWECEERLPDGKLVSIALAYAEPFIFLCNRKATASVAFGMSDGRYVHTFLSRDGQSFSNIQQFDRHRLSKELGESEASARLFVVATGGILTLFDPTRQELPDPMRQHMKGLLKKEGHEKVGSVACDVYVCVSEQGTHRLCFDQKDGLLMRQVFESRDGKRELAVRRKEANMIPKVETKGIRLSFDDKAEIRDVTDTLLPRKKR